MIYYDNVASTAIHNPPGTLRVSHSALTLLREKLLECIAFLASPLSGSLSPSNFAGNQVIPIDRKEKKMSYFLFTL
jgi:hypothetical protein